MNHAAPHHAWSRLVISAVLASAAAVLLLWPDAPSVETRSLVVLQTSDTHGEYLEPGDEGWPRLASAVIRETDSCGGSDNRLLIDCGDTFQGSFAASIDKGNSAVSIINHLGYDVFVPGNHDFDFGVETLLRHVAELRCATLAANLRMRDGHPPPEMTSWRLLTKNGLKVAVLGCTSPSLSNWLWDARRGVYSAGSLADALSTLREEVLAANPDIVVLAVHHSIRGARRLGGGTDLADALKANPWIHLALGGHSHQEVSASGLPGGAWFVQSGAHCKALAKITIKWNVKTRRIHSMETVLTRVAGLKPDSETLALVRPIAIEADSLASKPILEESDSIDRRALNLPQAVRLAAQAQIGVCGVFSGILPIEHTTTWLDVFHAAPYEDGILTIELSKQNAVRILAEQAAARKDERKDRALRFAGMVAVSDDKGNVSDVRLDGCAAWPDGTRLRAAFSTYDACGAGGRFPELRSVFDDAADIEKSDITIRGALTKWLNPN